MKFEVGDKVILISSTDGNSQFAVGKIMTLIKNYWNDKRGFDTDIPDPLNDGEPFYIHLKYDNIELAVPHINEEKLKRALGLQNEQN